MYCEKCGNKLEEGAKFCNFCGTPVPVKEDAYGKTGADRETELFREENGGNAPESGRDSGGDKLSASAESDVKKDSGNGKKTAVITVSAIAVVLIVAGVLFGLMKSRKPEEKEIPEAAVLAETEETAGEPEENTAEPADAEAEEQEPAVKDYYVDYETAYKEIVRQAAYSEKGASGWSLFDMDGDGMPELFVMEGRITADHRCVAYTYDIETGTTCCLGEVLPKSGMLFEPENRESGIIAVEAHMGEERVCFVKKEGKDKLNITEISPSQYVERPYYTTPYPINVTEIDQLDSFTGVLAGTDGITGLKTPDGMDVVQITCKAYATSVLQEPDRKHSTANLLDSDASTVWVEGVEGTGKGEAVVFDTRDSYPADGIVILPGYCRDQEVYEKNGHPVKITVKCGSMVISESMENFRPDFDNIENSIIYIEFDEPVYADTITVVISKAAGGTEYEDTCIAELYPYRCMDLSEYDY